MLLTIYDRYKQKRVDVSPDDNGTQVKEVQGENVLTLSFTLYEYVALDVNDYIDYLGERYWLMERYQPKQKSTVEWDYSVKFVGIESLVGRFLVLKTVDSEDEPIFSLTAPPKEHLNLIIQAINDGMGNITDYKAGSVEGTENITIEYEGKYCDAALKELAEKVGTEYWFEGQTLNLCRCEYGEEVTLAYGKGLTELDKDTADNVKFYTRLFPIGSSRNINPEYYGYSRLQLPSKEKYVDVNTDKYGIHHHYEKDAFAEIYPRRVGKISSVRSEEVTGEDGTPFKIYYFKDNDLTFDPNEYELPGLVKRVTFQDGELAGQGLDEGENFYFEVNYHSDTREFEIITIWPKDNDMQLPNDTLIPEVDNQYVLWNISMPPEYYILAEEELATAVNKFNEQNAVDVSRYKAPTDYIYIEENDIDLFIGRKVRLESAKFFPQKGYRNSRITKITRKINNPSQMDIEISDALSTGYKEAVGGEINDVKNYAKSIANSLSLPDIIRSWDNTLPTDNNLFSARRSQKEFLSKLKADRAKKKITFEEGADFGDYTAGHQGGTVDDKGNAELLSLVVRELLRSAKFVDGFTGEGFRLWIDEKGLANLTLDKLTVRQIMTVLELLIQRVRSVGGQIVVSAANGKIKSVELVDGYYKITFEQENTFVAHDLMRCATFTGGTLKSYWVEVASVEGNSVLVAEEEFDSYTPEVADECVLMGNTENPLRQSLISIAATEDGQPRVDVMDGVSGKSFADCLRARLGNLDGIKDDRFPLDNQPKGDGLYADNVYLRGTFLLDTGIDVKTQFQITESKIKAAVEGLRQDFVEDKGFLSNVTFGDGMKKWSTANEVTFFLAGNKWIWANGNVLSNKKNYAIVGTDNGRTVVHIRNRYIKQLNNNLRSLPTFETNENGELEAVPVYLSFFYRCAKPGTLKVEFENVDKAGFANFNSMYVEEELAATDGYRQYTCSGLWNGTGDFCLSFTGDIYLYMLVLSTDRIDSLTYKYRTLFEQSDRLIKITAAVFDKDENALKETGLFVKPEGAGLYAQNADGKFALVGVCVDGVDEDGNPISIVKLTADNVQLEGLVTANKTFKINEDGTMSAIGGTIGGFEIGEKSITAKESILYLGVEEFQVRFQAVSNVKKTITVNAVSDGYMLGDYEFSYNENRRITIPNKTPNSYNWQNAHVVDFMDLEYYSMFTTPTFHFNKYGFQYAMLGNGHLCLDGIIEGHCVDVIKPFTKSYQVHCIQMPLYCNRICASSEYDNNVLVLPDIQSLSATIGCGFVREETRRPFSFKMAFMNTGSKALYICGYSTDIIGNNDETPLAVPEFPKIHNKSASYYTGLQSLKLSPYNVIEFMLIYDGAEYKALII